MKIWGFLGILILALNGLGCRKPQGQCRGAILQHAALNPFVISYDPAVECVDLALIDGFVVGATGRNGRFARSQAEHDQGIRALPGDTITVAVYFDNGGADLPEYTAANVRTLVTVDATTVFDHHISARLTADNAEPIDSGIRGGDLVVHTAVPTKLEYVSDTTLLCITRQEANDRGINSAGTCGSDELVAVRVPDGDSPRVIAIGNLVPGFAHSGSVDFKLRAVPIVSEMSGRRK